MRVKTIEKKGEGSEETSMRHCRILRMRHILVPKLNILLKNKKVSQFQLERLCKIEINLDIFKEYKLNYAEQTLFTPFCIET